MKSHFDMITDTPRTDACEYVAMRRHAHYDRFAIARELERELAAVEAQRDRLAEVLERIDYCLSGVEDVIHGDGTDGISVARKIIIEALAAVEGGQP